VIPEALSIFIQGFGGPQLLPKEDITNWGPPPFDVPNARRSDLATLFKALGYTKGAEVGVEQGVFSEALLQKHPDLTLHCIDAWKTYRAYRDHVRQSKLDGFMNAATARLAQFGERAICHRGFSMHVVEEFPSGYFDFVYIDANHSFDFIMEDLIEWSKRVRPGGIVSGHDYIKRKDRTCQVVEAVQVYTEAHQINPWFTISGDVANGEPRSFFWVKQ
jgi:hypothetical protein